MLYKLFENIREKNSVYTSARKGEDFEEKIKSFLKSNSFTEIQENDISNFEKITIETANDIYKILKDKIVDKNSIEVSKNPYKNIKKSFIFQPYGKQNFPDFIVLLDNFVIPIEVKFSTNEKKGNPSSKPMWNSNLPKANSLYIYARAGISVTFFKGSDILPQDTRELLLGFWERITKGGDLWNKFNDDIKKLENPFGFYPYIRKAYTQNSSVATYKQETENGTERISIEPYFSENSSRREENLINFLKETEKCTEF